MKYTVMFHEFTQRSIQQLIGMYGAPRTVIEIGCFEGHTTFGLTEMLVQKNSNYKHYAIDPYDMSDDLALDVLNEAGQLFMSNLEEFKYKDNVEFIHDTSWNGLLKLLHRGVKADLIYIDGDHRAETVLNDLVLAFGLVDVGGVILCDDCVSWKHQDSEKRYNLQSSPKLAVDNFIQCNWDKVEVLTLNNGYQTAFRKLK
jgi:predicted O-methyltransferase YrrM